MKIRDGQEGELTAEIFETIFPDDPVLFLMDFLKTDGDRITLAIRHGNEILVTTITRDYAQALLDEFKEMRKGES